MQYLEILSVLHSAILSLGISPAGQEIGNSNLQPGAPVTALAFLNDSVSIASGGPDGRLNKWVVSDGSLKTASLAESPITCLTCSTTSVISGHSNGFIISWDINGKSFRLRKQLQRSSVLCLSLSKSGKRIAASFEDGSLFVCDTEGYDVIFQTQSRIRPLSLQFLVEDELVVGYAGGQMPVVIALKTGQEHRPYRQIGESVSSIAVSESNDLIAIGGRRGSLTVIKAKGGQTVWKASHGQLPITSLEFSPDGQALAAAGWEGKVFVREALSGRQLHSLTGHIGRVLSLAFSRDGTLLASGGDDCRIVLWKMPSGIRHVSRSKGHQARITGLTFDTRGDLMMSLADDGVAKLWDVKQRDELGAWGTQESRVSSIALSSDGTRIALTAGDSFTIYSAKRGSKLWTCDTPGADFTGIAFSADSKWLVTSSMNCAVRVWNVGSKELSFRLQDHGSELVVSPDSLWVVGYGRNAQSVSIATASDGVLRKVIDWDKESLDGVSSSLDRLKVAFTPSGKLLLVASTNYSKLYLSGLRIYECANWEEVSSFEHTPPVNCAVWLNENVFVTGDRDGRIVFWDAKKKSKNQVLEAHRGPITTLVYNANRGLLASGGCDSVIRLWTVKQD